MGTSNSSKPNTPNPEQLDAFDATDEASALEAMSASGEDASPLDLFDDLDEPLPPGVKFDRRKARQGDADENDASIAGLERRRGRGRRLSDFIKAAEEGEMTKEQFLFLVAIDAFKKANRVSYPSWTDVLEVIRLLGYRKTMPSEIAFRNAEDWSESQTAPSGVRPDRWHERFKPGELGRKKGAA